MSMNRCAINTTDGGPWLQVWEMVRSLSSPAPASFGTLTLWLLLLRRFERLGGGVWRLRHLAAGDTGAAELTGARPGRRSDK